MHDRELYRRILGIEAPWTVSAIDVDLKGDGVTVHIEHTGAFVPEVAESGDEFGYALAAGNFNCDQYDDLAVGVHHEDIGSTQNAGAAVVLYGGPSGIGNAVLPAESFHQGWGDVIGGAETGDRFGNSLAIGVPRQEFESGPMNVGAVSIVYGTNGGWCQLAAKFAMRRSRA